MERLIRKRLKKMGEKVTEGIENCQIILERLKDGQPPTVEDTIEINLLKRAIERLSAGITARMEKEEVSSRTETLLDTLVDVQYEAEALHVRLEIRCKPPPVPSGTTVSHYEQAQASRLPTLQVPKFSGDILKWQEFSESFNSIIAQKKISDVDRLHHLKQCVEGEAQQVIGGLVNTNANYKIAMDRLTHRFGKPGRIIDAHSRAISQMAIAGPEIADCRRTLDDIEKHLDILQSLGENPNSNHILRATLLDKFPDTITQELHTKTTSDSYSVDELRIFLDQIITSRENHKAGESGPTNGIDQHTSFTTDALYASSQQQGKRNYTPSKDHEPPKKRDKPHCPLCQGEHYADKCQEYRTLSERRNRLIGHCFLCLRKGHFIASCKPKWSFPCRYCRKFKEHNSCLCPAKFGEKRKHEESTSMNFSMLENDTILPTALTPIHDPFGNEIYLRVLLDCGSQRSYITADSSKRLKLTPLESVSLTIYSFGNAKPKTVHSSLVNVVIPVGSQNMRISAYVVPTTTSHLPSFHEFKSQIQRDHTNITFARDVVRDSPADIIIGNDYYHSFITGERKKLGPKLYLENTRFGWIVTGVCPQNLNGNALSVLTFVNSVGKGESFSLPDPPFEKDNIRDLWELETIGIRDSPKALQDEEVVHHFNNTTQVRDGRYYVKWPWTEYPPNLPVNFGQSIGRLRSLLKHASLDLKHRYDMVLIDQLEKGIIEIVPDTNLTEPHPVHYLPHHGVVQENKTTKLRIVYDGSAKVKGQSSLNELLYKGPSLLEDLTSLLLKFRLHQVGIVSDIEKAFLQVGLQEEDRDVTRFLWIKNLNEEPSNNNLIHFRFCRVPFGIICSPFLLAATVKLHLSRAVTPESRQLSNDLYVDNLVTGCGTVDHAVTLYREARRLFDQLSMNIREWNSNSREFMDLIPAEQRSDQSITSVLGLKWNTGSDSLSLGVDVSLFDRKVSTKRGVLKIIASIFDPCGWAAPYTLPTRVFLQSLWEDNVKWDSTLTQSHLDYWASCIQFLKAVPTVVLNRYYFGDIIRPPHQTTSYELHCFTDASKDAYVAAVYLRSKDQDKVIVNLVISKSRLTPIKYKKTFTIPKLELLAVFIGTRLVEYVQKTLGLEYKQITVWSDSMIVLSWLKSNKLLPPFVSRRVDEIVKSKHVRFRHVPSRHNPADIATRQMSSPIIPDMWFQGPDFLRKPPASWPDTNATAPEVDAATMTYTAMDTPSTPAATGAPKLSNKPLDYGALPPHGTDIELTTLLDLQKQYFPKETSGISTPLSKSLGLYPDNNGLIRCKGRFTNADLTYNQKYPVLLPRDSSLTDKLIMRVHEENHHVGVSHTLSILRTKFWIPHGRAKVSRILHTCEPCIKYGGGPYQLPPMSDLPMERAGYSPPFTYTGLDYLGPLFVMDNGVKAKRYCCLYTCMAVRAIHLELVKDLSAEEFLLGLRRFVATRSAPKLIVSDNATHFKLASSILSSPLVVSTKLSWKFIPALSPWQGGFYERLVGLVKNCLYRSLGTSLLGENQLSTFLKEVEATLNTRPLTTVGQDMELVLTPSHFLRSAGPPVLDLLHNETLQLSTSVIQRQVVDSWKRTSNMLDKFRNMFTNQYLTSLREHHVVGHRQPRVLSKRGPALGDTVQIKGDHGNRAKWKVGRITALLPSADGNVRTARVTLACGGLLSRSVSHLYPLELHSPPAPASRGAADEPDKVVDSVNVSGELDRVSQAVPVYDAAPSSVSPRDDPSEITLPTSSPADPDIPSASSRRSTRLAARQANDRIKLWTSALFSAAVDRLPMC